MKWTDGLRRVQTRRSTRLLVACAVLAAGTLGASTLGATRTNTIYVSAAGDDKADGLTPATAVLSPEQGRKLAIPKGVGTTILFSGQFTLTKPLVLDRTSKQMILASAPGGQAAFKASPGTKFGIIAQGADGVRITDLAFSGFSEDAISIRNSRRVVVMRNEIRETLSHAWSQGAIHFTGNVAGARIQSNVVSGADYAGIIVDTDTRSDVSDVRISGNRVTATCRRVSDCGAIYINDRSRRSRRIFIERNVVSGFSGEKVSGRGIYLDDWASHVTVTNNSVAGPGTYAFQIHGGHDVILSDNEVDLRQIRQFVLYQKVRQTNWSTMRRNRIVRNCFLGTQPESLLLVWPKTANLGVGRPSVSGQTACSKAMTQAPQ